MARREYANISAIAPEIPQPNGSMEKWARLVTERLNTSFIEIHRVLAQVGAGALLSDDANVQVVSIDSSLDTSYTVGDDCVVLCYTGTANVTINLPTAGSVTGRLYIIKKTTTDTKTVTLDPNGTETIEGVTTFAWGASGERDTYMIVSDGTEWWFV